MHTVAQSNQPRRHNAMDVAGGSSNSAKLRFEKLVRRYYYMLTFGCQDTRCTFKMCASSPSGPRLTPQAAAIMAVQLASRPKHVICPRIPADPDISLKDDLSKAKAMMSIASNSEGSVPPTPTSSNDHDVSSTKPASSGVSGISVGGSHANVTGTSDNSTTQSPIASPRNGRRRDHLLNAIVDEDPMRFLDGGRFAGRRSLTLQRELGAGSAALPSQPDASFSPGPAASKPFLHSFLSSSTFSSLFKSSDDQLAHGNRRGTDDVNYSSSGPSTNAHGRSKSAQPPTRMGNFGSLSYSDLDKISYNRDESPLSPTSNVEANGSSLASSIGHIGNYLKLGAFGRLQGVDGDGKTNKAKSWMDLPSLFSASLNFNSNPDISSNTSTPVRSISPQQSSLIDDEFQKKLISSSGLKSLISSALESDPASEESLNSEGPSSTATNEFLNVDRLDLDILERAIQACTGNVAIANRENKSYSILLNLIKNAFRNADVLNDSFLVSGASDGVLGIDVEALRKSYELIWSTEYNDMVERTMFNALEILLASLELNVKRLQFGPTKSLRSLIIILENPLLQNPKHQDTLIKKLSIVFDGLRSKSKLVLAKWFSAYDSGNFIKVIRPFQSYINQHFYPGQKPDEHIIGSVKALSLLYHANEMNTPIIPISEFYNESICEKLNFKEEYKNWKKTLEKAKITEFSFFNYPFLLDPVAKTRILHIDAMVQMSQEFEGAVVHQALVIHAQRFLQDSPSVVALEKGLKGAMNPFLVLEVRRDHMVKDVLDHIRNNERDLKKPLKVKFVGGGEEGMDQGGVQKEFFQVLINMLLDPSYGMFTYEEDTRFCWVNGASLESETKFELVGIVLGLALYNGVILGVNFPGLLYKKLLDEEPTLEDVKVAFPLLDWSDGDVSDIFMRSFEISYEVYGQVKTFPLVENGSDIMVTNNNRKEYVDLYIRHLVGDSVKRQFVAFRRGFHKVCGGRALKMCRPEELELLICGTTELDFSALETGATYDDGYDASHQVIKWFWSIVHKMTLDQKRKLLMFVTASDRVPLKGLGNLTFVIQRNGPDSDRLPTALTCFGRLLLPEYSSREKVANRLITAIENAKGFGLV
ncbi:hypothetical protein HDV05_008505 [Chytridiales sp. JEL 0842]|nr:hypothetical protein HDV05_008505 [Chytridiales sp. JEL 0842]